MRRAVRHQAGGEEVCGVRERASGLKEEGGRLTVVTFEASTVAASEVPGAGGAGATAGCPRGG